MITSRYRIIVGVSLRDEDYQKSNGKTIIYTGFAETEKFAELLAESFISKMNEFIQNELGLEKDSRFIHAKIIDSENLDRIRLGLHSKEITNEENFIKYQNKQNN